MKKVLALFLALMMVLSLFTACAKQPVTFLQTNLFFNCL